jgi:ribonuclease-3
MEFLGDAILSAVVADILYRRYPNRREGFLTNSRSKIVQRESLDRIARELGLDKLMRSSVRLSTHHSHLYGNTLEALIGAVYLDRGYKCCYRFIEKVIIRRHINLENIVRKEVNFKSSLIEWSQKHKVEIHFNVIESFTDDEGNSVFRTAVCMNNEQIGVGVGYTKKESHQNAARMAVRKLRSGKAFRKSGSSQQFLANPPSDVSL